MSVGTKEDVYTLSAGDVVLQWPSNILPEEFIDVDDWLKLMRRKMKRSVVEEVDVPSLGSTHCSWTLTTKGSKDACTE